MEGGGVLDGLAELVRAHDDVEGRGGHRSRGDRVDPDAGSEVGSGEARVVGEGRLRRPVGEVAAAGQAAHHRRDVHHRAATLVEQGGDGGPGERVRRGHVEVEGGLELLGCRVEEGAWQRASDVVHDDVEATQPVSRRADQRGHGGEVGQVGGVDDGSASGGSDPAGHLLELVGAAGGEHDVGARLREGDRRGRADAPSRTGDDRDPAGEREAVEDHAPASSAGLVGGRPSLRWSHETVRSTCTFATMRLWSIVSTKGRRSSW